ncbi:dirigent protein 22-like [Rhododendron vialii]|uniref:dirigent protein 22-like n=1 Tax=Rhododendron vialii TaxID=182163 RepID=UPI00265D6A6E|nr:dirigent protein 22-like [Rhododendron vialii]
MMEKLAAIGIVVVLVLFSPMAMAIAEGPKEVEEWFHKFDDTTSVTHQKVTKLHFYFHDLRGLTTAVVAQSNTTAASPTFFGLFYAMDNPLTVGPSQASKVIGRAQGLYGSTSREKFSLTLAMNLVFTNGPYNGSSLTVLGYNPVMQPKREMPVVGGAGVFRMARGVALLKTYFFDAPRGNATIEYNVIVHHY